MIGLIGLGNFGTALGHVISSNGYEVLGWERQQRVVEQINREARNTRYLPHVSLQPNFRASGDLALVLRSSEVIFIALPARFIGPTLEPLRHEVPSDVALVNTSKGISQHTGLTAGQALANLLPNNPRVILSGPSIANEFASGLPTIVVLAGRDDLQLKRIAGLLQNAFFGLRFSDDEIGVELGGALKNAYVVGLGLLDGLGIGSVNLRAVYLTLALAEMTRVGVALGAQRETFAFLAGAGDLLATATSEHSHNRRLGRLLAQGQPIVEIERSMGVLPEGYSTVQALLLLAEQQQVAIPIAGGLWDLINGRSSAERFLEVILKHGADERSI